MKKNKSIFLVAFFGIMFMVCLGFNRGTIVLDGTNEFIDPVPMPYSETSSIPNPGTPIIPDPEESDTPEPVTPSTPDSDLV